MYREAEEDEEDSDEDLAKKAFELETAASTTVDATETPLEEDDEEKNEDEEEEKFETRWRCWKCKKIFKMDEQCPTHLVNLGDYEEYDFDTLLVEVKVNKEKSATNPAADILKQDLRTEEQKEADRRWEEDK